MTSEFDQDLASLRELMRDLDGSKQSFLDAIWSDTEVKEFHFVLGNIHDTLISQRDHIEALYKKNNDLRLILDEFTEEWEEAGK